MDFFTILFSFTILFLVINSSKFADSIIELIEGITLISWVLFLDIIVPMSGYEGNVNYDLTRQDGALSKVMDDNLFRKRFPTFKFTELTKGCLNTVNYYDSIYPY